MKCFGVKTDCSLMSLSDVKLVYMKRPGGGLVGSDICLKPNKSVPNIFPQNAINFILCRY